MEWIDINNRKPTAKDGLVVVSSKSGFKEIVFFSLKGKKVHKPWAFDKDDIPISDIKTIKYWFKLTEPIQLTKQLNHEFKK